MSKKVIWAVVICIGIGGLAYPKLATWLPSANSSSPATNAGTNKPAATDGAKRANAPLQVATFLVEATPFVETITSTGTVRADEGVELQAETNGKVVSINFTEGSAVKKGDLLVKLNDAELRANLDRYNYSKELSEIRFRRYQKLLEQRVVTQDEFDNALHELNIQLSLIDLYKAQIEKTEIRAPFDGVVGLRYVSVGSYVNANIKIATLQRIDNLKIDFAVPEKYSGRIKVGNEISFTVAGGLKKYQGTIYAVDPRIDESTRTMLVRAVTSNTDSSLLPGAFTNVEVALEELPDALFVPAEAVIPGLEEKNVFVMRDGVAEMRAVQTGTRTATQVHILSGLQPGDLVITSGLQQMREGLSVAPIFDPRSSKDVGAAVTTKVVDQIYLSSHLTLSNQSLASL